MTSKVAVRELKDRLSEYLRRVEAGEELIVTSRGKPVARLLPPQAPPVAAGEALQGALSRLSRQPWYRPAAGERYVPPATIPWPEDARPLSELVLGDRG